MDITANKILFFIEFSESKIYSEKGLVFQLMVDCLYYFRNSLGRAFNLAYLCNHLIANGGKT